MKLPSVYAVSMAAAFLLLSGCVGYVPSFSQTASHGRAISRSEARFIVPGKTTRAEVRRGLGSNYREGWRMPALAYAWEMPAGTGWLIIGGQMGGAAVTHGFVNWHALFVAFDSSGVVTRKEFVRLNGKLTLDEQLDQWAGGPGPHPSAPPLPW